MLINVNFKDETLYEKSYFGAFPTEKYVYKRGRLSSIVYIEQRLLDDQNQEECIFIHPFLTDQYSKYTI